MGGAKCSDVVTYLKKDRFHCDETASATKRVQVDPTVDLKCDLCSVDISISSTDTAEQRVAKKHHYMMYCEAIPGPKLSGENRKDILNRVAALSLVKKLSSMGSHTENVVNGVFHFTARRASPDPDLRDGQQRSDREPPD